MLALLRLVGTLLLLVSSFTALATPTSTKPIRQATRDEVVKRMLRPDRTWTAKREVVSLSACLFPNGFTLTDNMGTYVGIEYFEAVNVEEQLLVAVSTAAQAAVFTLDNTGTLFQLGNPNVGVVVPVPPGEAATEQPDIELVTPSTASFHTPLKCTITPSLNGCPISCSDPDQATLLECPQSPSVFSITIGGTDVPAGSGCTAVTFFAVGA